MKHTLRIVTALALAMTLALSLAACALPGGATPSDAATPSNAATPSDAAGYTDEERAQIAAKVGEYEITKGDVIDQYESMLSYYAAYGMQTPTAEADIESYQDYALSGIVLEKLILEQGKLLGTNPLTEAQLAEVKTEAEAFFADLQAQYESQAAAEGAADAAARAVEMINETLTQNGWGMDYDAYKDWYQTYLGDQKIVELTEAKYKEGVELTEEELASYYDEQVQSQTERFAETPSEYIAASEEAEMLGGAPALVVPEGFVRVKVLSIAPEGEIDATYTEKTEAMAKLEAEYGKLSLDASASASERLAEIQSEYATLKTETDALFTAHAASARASAEEAMEKLKAGTSFDEVLLAYGDDESYATYAPIGEKGRLMFLSGADDWAEALHTAVRGLEKGAYSDILTADGKLYIVQYVGEATPGTLTVDDAREALTEAAKAEKAETAWSEAQDAWLNDTSLVEYFEDVYRDIGKN